MGHNFVLLKKETDLNDFAQRAMLARENEYIPDGDETIVYTKLLEVAKATPLLLLLQKKALIHIYAHFLDITVL